MVIANNSDCELLKLADSQLTEKIQMSENEFLEIATKTIHLRFLSMIERKNLVL